MLTKTWYQKFKDARFLVANEEWSVFYPSGPFRGYLLQSSSVDRWARAILCWELIGVVCLWMVSLLIRLVFQCDFTLALLIGTLGFFLSYALWIRWLTRGLQSLPFGVGMRTYAALRDPVSLWELCVLSSLLTVGCAVFAVMGTERAFWIIYTIISSCITFIPAYIIYIRSRLSLVGPLSGDVDDSVTSVA